jgi:hypothetical protein
MNKEFIPYEEAVELKALGFDEPCFAVYSEHDKTRVYEESSIVEGLKIQAPLYQQAFRWFRDNHLLVGEVFTQIKPSNKFMYGFKIAGSDKILDGFNSYEDAELECLKKLIEIVKKK